MRHRTLLVTVLRILISVQSEGFSSELFVLCGGGVELIEISLEIFVLARKPAVGAMWLWDDSRFLK